MASRFENRSLLIFCYLSSALFIAPLTHRMQSIWLVDFVFVFLAFLATMLVQCGLIFGVTIAESRWRRLDTVSALVCGALLIANSFYFFFILLSLQRSAFLLPAAAVVALFCISRINEALRRYTVTFVRIFIAISLIVGMVNTYSPAESESANYNRAAFGRSANRGVYVVVFDSLVSRRSLEVFYEGRESRHVKSLEREGFQLYDVRSAGESTIASFHKMFSLGKELSGRRYKTFFNGIDPVPLYELLRDHNYQIQFLSGRNYFGVDAGKIDSYLPKRSVVTVCDFVDARYLVFPCADWFRKWRNVILVPGAVEEFGADGSTEVQYILSNLAFADSGKYWFSVSYINFPAHSPSNHVFADSTSRARVISEMNRKVARLGEYFSSIKDFIQKKDPNAIIVFVGDHGGWLTRSAQPGEKLREGLVLDRELIDLDRRGILLAVFPKEACNERLYDRSDTSLLFDDLVQCASDSR